MPKHEALDRDRPGRHSGIRRLVYRALASEQLDGKINGKGAWRDSRDWSAIKDQLRLTVRRAPEVIINVKGSRRSKDDDRGAVAGVLRYMMYISRNGRLLTVNEHGDQLSGRDAIREVHASWDLDMQRTRGGKGESLHPSFNIIFSMPAKTDPEKLLDAVQAFAAQRFHGHQYVLAIHTHETDPADDAPEHPHVHLILRAEDNDGKRIYIRKGDLRVWREEFASQLRARGIEANATSRAERGKSLKALSSAEWHIQRRYREGQRKGESAGVPKAKFDRFQEAAQELQGGRVEPKPWEIAMAARRRNVLRGLSQSVDRLRQEGDIELAEQVEQFIQDMPPLDSERRLVQRALAERLQKRLQEHGQDKQEDTQSNAKCPDL